MSHPVIDAIKLGKSPRPIRLATAQGLLPLGAEDLLESLSILIKDPDEEIQSAIRKTLSNFDPEIILSLAKNSNTLPSVLAFLCFFPSIPENVTEAVLFNSSTPDDAILQFAISSLNPSLLEVLTINQQRLIRMPQLVNAILHNPKSSSATQRCLRELHKEFFEKEYGKQQINEELAAQKTSLIEASVTQEEKVVEKVKVDLPKSQKVVKLSSVDAIARIQTGTAPRPAKLMIAMGKLPLAPDDLLFAQVLLVLDPDDEISSAAIASIDNLDPQQLLPVCQNPETPEDVLAYLMTWKQSTPSLSETLLLNNNTPVEAILKFAKFTKIGSLLELITVNQQRLISTPKLIDVILENPACTPEAQRHAREVRVEFFEKELGAQRVAEEKRARAEKFVGIIETPVSEEEFNAVLAEFEAEIGMTISDDVPSDEEIDSAFNRMIAEVKEQEGIDLLSDLIEDSPEHSRLSIYQQLAKMSVKERIFAALKGGREARGILVRDPNKLIATGVVRNPRISDPEVEAIANIKGISEDVIRVIAMNRAWISSYSIMHNLIRNPRCPPNFSMQFLNRLQQRDLQGLSKSKSIPDMLRQAASRLLSKRLAGKG